MTSPDPPMTAAEWNRSLLDALPAARAEHDAELARLIARLDGFTPVARRRLRECTIRCPAHGCALGEVYRFALRGAPDAARFVFRGRTSSGKPKNGLLNWTYPDDWYAPVFYSVGCRHGLAKLGRGWVLDCLGAIHLWRHAMTSEEDFLASLSPEMAKGRVSRVFHPPGEAWTPRDSAVLPSS